MAEYFTIILNYIFSPLGIIGLVAVVGIIFFLKYIRGKEHAYKTQKLEKTVQEVMKDIMHTTGISQKNRLLRQGLIIIGKITTIAKVNYYPDVENNPHPKNKSKAELITEVQTPKDLSINPYEFIGFKVIGMDLLSKILALLGLGGNFFLIDKEFLIEPSKNQDFIIGEGTQFWKLAGISIFSEKGRKFVTDLVFKKIHEQVLEGELNFIPRMTYLEIRMAKTVEKGKLFTDLEKKRWSSQLEGLTDTEEE